MIQEFVKSQPLLSIILVSFVITFLLTLIYKLLIPQDKMKELKKRTKELQQKMKNEKDTNKVMEAQKEMLGLSGEQMKLSLKPMLITYLPLILVFMFLRNAYTGIGDIIHWGANLPIVGTGAGWLLCYIILSITFSIILRKLLGVQ